MASKRISQSGFADWVPARLPDLRGKTYLITGANSGIGFEAARYLGESGADIVMACRSVEKAERAKSALAKTVHGSVDVLSMDLSDLSSVRAAAEEARGRYDRIDGLINNAGIMQTPKTVTLDGFDLQMASNHLGHFLWTALMLDRVEAAEGRVVVVASLVHKLGALNFEDLMSEHAYDPTKAYAQSKLANLMFALALDRKLRAANRKAICLACHPGYSNTALQSTGPTGFLNSFYKWINPWLAQDQKNGAIPTVLAAAGAEAKRGGYYGPQCLLESRGRVSDAKVAGYALNQGSQERLWELSEQWVGHHFELNGLQ